MVTESVDLAPQLSWVHDPEVERAADEQCTR